ncbi:hypothetical protein ACFFUB_00810 [Algimonas porphyrae]|nr:hypothetical protein [Algimonas porphyrae]
MIKPLIFMSSLLLWPMLAHAQTTEPAPPSLSDRVTEAAKANRYRIEKSGDIFSGDGWDRLLAEGRQSQFFLLGEEHGIAENPQLAAALFTDLSESGYSRFAIEVSPFMAARMDDALAEGGLDGLKELFAEPGGQPAFFGMAEEAEMLATVRGNLADAPDVLWGTDYEVLGDRQMLRALEAMPKPEAAAVALSALRAESDAGWAKYEETRSPQFVFSFSGDPQRVRDVEAAWLDRSVDAAWILDQIEETLEINRLFVTGQNFASNKRRADHLVANFLRHWRVELADGRSPEPRVFAKYGASHLVRGRNSNGVFDLGTTLPELAALEGRPSVSLFVLPGQGSSVAVFDPTAMTFRDGAPKDGYGAGMGPLYDAAFDSGYTLIDLRPLRAVLTRTTDPDLVALARTIHGFDYVLIMTGSTPSSALLVE